MTYLDCFNIADVLSAKITTAMLNNLSSRMSYLFQCASMNYYTSLSAIVHLPSSSQNFVDSD